MRSLAICALVAVIVAAPIPGAAQARPGGAGTSQASAGSLRDTKVLAGGRADAFTTIQGTALGSGDLPLPNTTVRLRDIRSGRVVQTATTDKAGRFAFRKVDPGSYIVEVMGADKTTVLGASEILNVNAGDVVTAFIKLPFQNPPLAGALGRTGTAAVLVTAAAAASGVLATQIAGEQKSPRQ